MAKKKKKDQEDDFDSSNDEGLEDFSPSDDIPLVEFPIMENDQTPAIAGIHTPAGFKPQYFDVATPVALFPFISFKGDKRQIREWQRTAVNPNDGSLIVQKLRFIADASTKKTAQGKAAWLALLGIKYLWERRNRPDDGKVSFSMHELCRIFDLPYNGRRAKEFYEAFIALNRMTIESSNALTLIEPQSGKRKPVEKEVNSQFISFFGRIKTGEKGQEFERYYVQINPIYVHCLNTQDSSTVNLAMIANLKSARSISLYVLLCTLYQNYRSEIIDYNLADIAEDLPLKPERNSLSKVKEDLEPVLMELIRNKLLKSFTYLSASPQKKISKRPKVNEVIIRFDLGQRLIIEPAQIPNLVGTNTLLITQGAGEDALIGRLCKIGFSVNQANGIYKMYSPEHLEYALDSYEKMASKSRISSPIRYFEGILEKVTPDQYQKKAKETRKQKAASVKAKTINEIYKEYFDTSRKNVVESEGMYWEELIIEEIKRLSQNADFNNKTTEEKRTFVEYDLLTSAPYNLLTFTSYKEQYMKGLDIQPYTPSHKKK